MPSQSEQQLLSKAVSGDTVALAELIMGYYDRLAADIARKITSQCAGLVDPEDVVQQTCVRAFSSITSFANRHKHSFYAWLSTIADNLLKDVKKRRGRERLAGESPPQAGNSDSFVELVARVARTSTTPSGTAMRGEITSCVEAALARLPEDYRQVIQWRYFEDRSIDEIAEKIGRTAYAVNGLCFRAKQKLREILGSSSLFLRD